MPDENFRRLHTSKSYAMKQSNYIKWHFIFFAIVASLNHALAYVVFAYASSLLDAKLSSIVLSLTWFLNAVSGFTIATFITRWMGYKIAIIVSFVGYTLQIYSLYISVIYPNIAWPVALTGAVVSGTTSAIWWTAQGICFELTCQELSRLQNLININITNIEKNCINRDSVKEDNTLDYEHPISSINVFRADLSAVWTLVYQIADILVFLILSILPLYMKLSFTETLYILVIIGIVTCVLGIFFDNLGDQGQSMSTSEIFSSIVAVPQQLKSDSRALLLAPFVFGFAITTAMFSYFINGSIENTDPKIGLNNMGILESYSYLVAVIVAFPYAYICTHFKQGSNFVMMWGTFSFMMCGILTLLYSDVQIASWKCLFILRTLYGMGRSVFEGACRAVYADLFKGRDLATAFSTQTLLAGFGGGICFYIFSSLSRSSIAMIAIINGIVGLITYSVLIQKGDRIDQVLPWSELLCCFNNESDNDQRVDHIESNMQPLLLKTEKQKYTEL